MDPTFWAKPIGTGMYKVNVTSFPNYFTAISFDDYYLDIPRIRNITFNSYVTGGQQSTYAAAIAGDLDLLVCLDINEANNIVASNPDMKLMFCPGTYNRYFTFNLNSSEDGKLNPDIFNVDVRHAINLAIDKEAIVNAFYPGQGRVATTRVATISPIFNSSIPLFKRDVAKSKELLAQANFDFSRTIRIMFYYDDQTTLDVMEVLKSNLADVGIQTETIFAQGDLVAILYEQRNYDLLYMAGGGDDAILQYRDSMMPSGGLADNIYGQVEFREANTASYIADYMKETDPAKKKELGDRIQAKELELMLTVPLYTLDILYLYNTRTLELEEIIFTGILSSDTDILIERWVTK